MTSVKCWTMTVCAGMPALKNLRMTISSNGSSDIVARQAMANEFSNQRRKLRGGVCGPAG